MNTILKLENIGKMYTISHQTRESYTALRDVISTKVKNLLTNKNRIEKDNFWALRNICFEIKEGERVGIIGRNGAGKSTLLKLISRITEPTEGKIEITGRVASLLEVGTGFHPELTGRENIYLNGAILGMSKNEIRSRFDEIVNFSETEDFIDTPVKRFSSGMYMKLAFSVAAHLRTEILIVDEVLAVGDLQFQKKCINKMEEVGRDGKTVIFVSHNMGSIQSLCNRGIVLNRGEIVCDTSVENAVKMYMEQGDFGVQKIKDRKDRHGSLFVKINDIKFIDSDTGNDLDTIVSGMPVTIEVSYSCKDPKEIMKYLISIVFTGNNGNDLFVCSNYLVGVNFKNYKGEGKFYCKISKWPLNTGTYYYRIYSEVNGHLADYLKDAGEITVESGDFFGTGAKVASHLNGVFIDHIWYE